MTGLDVVRGMGFRSLRLALLTGFAVLLALACLASSARARRPRVLGQRQVGTNRISFANLDGSGGGNISTAGAASGQPRGVTMDVVAGKVYWTQPGQQPDLLRQPRRKRRRRQPQHHRGDGGPSERGGGLPRSGKDLLGE